MDPVTAVGLIASVAQLADLVLSVITNPHNYYPVMAFERRSDRS